MGVVDIGRCGPGIIMGVNCEGILIRLSNSFTFSCNGNTCT